MNSHRTKNRSKAARWGWGILLGTSVLLILAGVGWYFSLPDMALENISEYANAAPETFKQGNPSSFDVIALIARGYGAGFAAAGLLAFLVGLEGYRYGTRWAWSAMWVLVLTYAAIAGTFMQAGESYALSLGILSFALLSLIGLVLARKDLNTVEAQNSTRG